MAPQWRTRDAKRISICLGLPAGSPGRGGRLALVCLDRDGCDPAAGRVCFGLNAMSDAGVVRHRRVITASVMLAIFVQTLDSTICIVALPFMQGSLSASAEEVSWVLTSSVIASAIMTAPAAWMAQRFGRKQVFMVCLGGFLCMSVFSGLSRSLGQLILCRLVQGMFGAALAPLCQATMLDIYPFAQRAQAMAIFAVGILMGPFMGPVIGGYLTDAYHWRLVFFVTLGPGLLALLGVE